MKLQYITYIAILCGVPARVVGQAHVRGLPEDRRQLMILNTRRTQYRNPCTGSWSNDKNVLNYDNCEEDMENGGNSLVIPSTDEDASEDESRFGGGKNRDIPPSLDCRLQIRDDPTSPKTVREVEYWYCVETDGTTNNTKWLPVLEDKIYNYARDILMWCLGYPVPDAGRRLGVFSVSSLPKDKIRPDGKVPNNVCTNFETIYG
jgi:hypothetical protein